MSALEVPAPLDADGAAAADVPVVSVLVVTYRCRDWARRCLSSLLATTTDLDLEVIVVDNASGDGTVEMVADEFPSVVLVANDDNVGFARAVNQAAALATGEHVLLLNPDTVVHEGCVQHLLEFARRHPEHGLVGGRTLRPDGTVDPSSCWGSMTPWSLACFALMLTTVAKRSRVLDPESLGRWPRDSVREVGYVTGCLLLARADTWRRLGGFDERFWMYGEDADLSERARALGLRPAITPGAVITHAVGVSSSVRSDKVVMVMRARVELVRTHWPRHQRTLGVGLLATGVAVRAALDGAAGRVRRGGGPSPWPAAWRQRREWLAGYPGPRGRRAGR